MDQIDTSSTNLDLDIDLESGGTSDEEASKSNVLSSKKSEYLLDRKASGLVSSYSLCGLTKFEDCSHPFNKFITSDDISVKNEEQMKKIREEIVDFVDKRMDKENPKRHTSAKPSKPPRPPRGPSLHASDMMLLKEISELNLKRKRLERIRTLKKTKEKGSSSLSSNLIACFVTLIFFLVIIFQGFLGSRV
ncbi:uncharacterized protein LOC127260383 [Andrographis paniculata]|uniref:uncharacterized protein LOC127260383 n=1 Tax=Andrographis paniculata TaxID=175694 RepID=UPI0021E8D634|nr:uncharacterized protein LOC127260383 [Andrographis paniculata]XP_051144061.1 uncharacterized protein LOC127260383 [Andrographis paniculata]XP_051144062.1 uncharacterized protein LOC127260383 [Andrographis paniculata]